MVLISLVPTVFGECSTNPAYSGYCSVEGTGGNQIMNFNPKIYAKFEPYYSDPNDAAAKSQSKVTSGGVEVVSGDDFNDFELVDGGQEGDEYVIWKASFNNNLVTGYYDIEIYARAGANIWKKDDSFVVDKTAPTVEPGETPNGEMDGFLFDPKGNQINTINIDNDLTIKASVVDLDGGIAVDPDVDFISDTVVVKVEAVVVDGIDELTNSPYPMLDADADDVYEVTISAADIGEDKTKTFTVKIKSYDTLSDLTLGTGNLNDTVDDITFNVGDALAPEVIEWVPGNGVTVKNRNPTINVKIDGTGSPLSCNGAEINIKVTADGKPPRTMPVIKEGVSGFSCTPDGVDGDVNVGEITFVPSTGALALLLDGDDSASVEVKVVVNDTEGNEMPEKTITFDIDVSIPEIKLGDFSTYVSVVNDSSLYLPEGYTALKIVFASEIDDITSLSISKDGSSIGSGDIITFSSIVGTSDHTFLYQVPEFEEGVDYILDFVAEDLSGSTTSYNFKFMIDRGGPVISNLVSSTHAETTPVSWYDETDFTISWNVNEPVSEYTYIVNEKGTLDGSDYDGDNRIIDGITISNPTQNEIEDIDVSSLVNGGAKTLYFHIRAKDGFGNWGANETFAFNVDNLAPEIDSVEPDCTIVSDVSHVIKVFADGTGSGIDLDNSEVDISGYIDGDVSCTSSGGSCTCTKSGGTELDHVIDGRFTLVAEAGEVPAHYKFTPTTTLLPLGKQNGLVIASITMVDGVGMTSTKQVQFVVDTVAATLSEVQFRKDTTVTGAFSALTEDAVYTNDDYSYIAFIFDKPIDLLESLNIEYTDVSGSKTTVLTNADIGSQCFRGSDTTFICSLKPGDLDSSNMKEGNYSITNVVANRLGSTGGAGKRTIVVDKTVPAITIQSIYELNDRGELDDLSDDDLGRDITSSGITGYKKLRIYGTVTNGPLGIDGIHVDMDGASINSEVFTDTENTFYAYIDYPIIIRSGDYTLIFTPVDKAGNEGSEKEEEIELDFTPPSMPTISYIAEVKGGQEGSVTSSSTTPLYMGDGDVKIVVGFDAETEKYSVYFSDDDVFDGGDNEIVSAENIPSPSEITLTNDQLDSNTPYIFVQAIDGIGNKAESEAWRVISDEQKPVISILYPLDSGVVLSSLGDLADLSSSIADTGVGVDIEDICIQVKDSIGTYYGENTHSISSISGSLYIQCLDLSASDYDEVTRALSYGLSSLDITEDETYTITINAYDRSGNDADSDSATFTLDNAVPSSPTIQVKKETRGDHSFGEDKPGAGETKTYSINEGFNEVKFQFDNTEDLEFVRSSAKRDGVDIGNMDYDTGTALFTFTSVDMLNEGEYNFVVTMRKRLTGGLRGPDGVYSVNLHVDKTDPTITNVIIRDSAEAGKVLVKVNAQDNVQLKSINPVIIYGLDAVEINEDGTVDGDNTNYHAELTNYEVVTISVEDGAGNIKSVELKRDSLDLEVLNYLRKTGEDLITFSADNYASVSTTTIEGDADFGLPIRYTVDSGGAINGGTTDNDGFTLTNVDLVNVDGTKKIRVYAENYDNNKVGFVEKEIELDTIKMSLVSATPENIISEISPVITFNLDTDGSPLECSGAEAPAMTITVDDSVDNFNDYGPLDYSSRYNIGCDGNTITFNPTLGLIDGADADAVVTLDLSVYDKAGNKVEIEHSFNIKTALPNIILISSSMEQAVQPNQNMMLDLIDDDYRRLRVEYSQDVSDIPTITLSKTNPSKTISGSHVASGTNTFTYNLKESGSTYDIEEGEYSLDIDSDGTSNDVSGFKFTIDNTAPVVNKFELTNLNDVGGDSYLGETTVLMFEITDLLSPLDLDSCEYTLDGSTWYDKDTKPSGVELLFDNILGDAKKGNCTVSISDTNGAVSIQMSAKDEAGNQVESDVVEVAIDSISPVISVQRQTSGGSDVGDVWVNYNLKGVIECSDDGAGCNPDSYMVYWTTTAISSCPDKSDAGITYVDYDSGSITERSTSGYLCAYGEDNGGNHDYSDVIKFKIDSADPTIVIDSWSPVGTIANDEPTFTVQINGTGSDVDCDSIDIGQDDTEFVENGILKSGYDIFWKYSCEAVTGQDNIYELTMERLITLLSPGAKEGTIVIKIDSLSDVVGNDLIVTSHTFNIDIRKPDDPVVSLNNGGLTASTIERTTGLTYDDYYYTNGDVSSVKFTFTDTLITSVVLDPGSNMVISPSDQFDYGVALPEGKNKFTIKAKKDLGGGAYGIDYTWVYYIIVDKTDPVISDPTDILKLVDDQGDSIPENDDYESIIDDLKTNKKRIKIEGGSGGVTETYLKTIEVVGSGVANIPVDVEEANPYIAVFDLTDNDGVKAAKIKVTDKAGNSVESDDLGIELDETAPAAPTITAKESDGVNDWITADWYTESLADVSWSSEGAVEYSYILVDDGTTVTTDGAIESGTITTSDSLDDFDLGVSDGSSGTKVFYVNAKDDTGNWGQTSSFTFNVDRKAPEADNWVPESDATFNTNKPTIKVDVMDEGAGIDCSSVDFKIDGISRGLSGCIDGSTALMTLSYTFTFDLAFGAEQRSSIPLKFSIADKGGKLLDVSQFTFNIDNRTPTIRLGTEEKLVSSGDYVAVSPSVVWLVLDYESDEQPYLSITGAASMILL